jgi:hypothetical protein
MHLGGSEWKTYYGRKNEPGEHRSDKGDEHTTDVKLTEDGAHFWNFIEAVRTNKRELQTADILEGHLSAAMCHLSNIAYRTGRQVVFDSANECFHGDSEASSLLRREYRLPFVVPEKV